MRNLLGVVVVAVALATGACGQVQAADLPEYPAPQVDYDQSGSIYVRGSVALNVMTGGNITYRDCCGVINSTVTGAGYGYSLGGGIGYEVGNGFRFDGTIDYLSNTGMTDGTYALSLSETLLLANAYYDIPIGNGGLGAYLGAGIGAAYNQTHVTGPGAGPDGATWTAAGALMAGLSWDMGNWVADVGYRLVYMPTITNGAAGLVPPALGPYYVNNDLIHEVRATLRYRFK